MKDRVSLAAGLACLLVGAVFGLDQLGVIDLSAGLVAAVVCAAAGLVLVVSGLEPGDGGAGRGDR
ncbi:MAG: hypothetical protein KDB58_14005 [Solirubrobacterales bacterium]|nr:hypothetical protein [Solirubrobacterales bacterium]MCB8969818.1 hypothetical protein [Thermoleophilales bacterium]MCO5327545.1 hypothetical protein [Solirubrobacterales bacterium]